MSALLRTNGVAKLVNRRLLQLQGVDASRFIQAILTNDMKHVAKPGDAIYGGFLTTKGRLLGDCNIVQTQVCGVCICVLRYLRIDGHSMCIIGHDRRTRSCWTTTRVCRRT